MTLRQGAVIFGLMMTIYGGLALVPGLGPLLVSTVGWLFLATGLIQLASGIAGSSRVTCPHCEKRSEVRLEFWRVRAGLTAQE